MNCLANNLKSTIRAANSTSLNSLVKGQNFDYGIYFKQFLPFENKRLIHKSAAFYAGHSKWQNIKETKGSKDLTKGQVFQKIACQMKIACREPGGTDPKLNTTLAKLFERAKQMSMPMSTIEKVFKAMENLNVNAKPGALNLFGPQGMVMCVDVHTDNMNRTRTDIRSFVKKHGFKDHPNANVDSIFNAKGYIITKPGDLEKAMEDAIEVGAEDVEEDEDKMLKFICDPLDFPKVKNKIENLKYDVEYASVDKIPYSVVEIDLPEKEMEKLQTSLAKIEEHHEVIKIHYNFEL